MKRLPSRGRLIVFRQRIRRLRWPDVAEILKAFAVASAIELGIRTIKMPVLARMLGVPLDTRAGEPAAPMVDSLPAWAKRRLYLSSDLMDMWPFGGTCLRRSLLAGHRLRKLKPVLRIGVARPGGVLAAHAWVEIDGRYFDPEAIRFSPLSDVPT